jgi:hypothetical protein
VSYGLGTDAYEANIIKDCFGVERLHEYIGKGVLDVVIVYGISPWILEQAPGGRVNAKMVSRSHFASLSLPDMDGNFFLRPDRILGMFLIDSSSSSTELRPPLANKDDANKADGEIEACRDVVKHLAAIDTHKLENSDRVASLLDTVKHSSSSHPEEEASPQRNSSLLLSGLRGIMTLVKERNVRPPPQSQPKRDSQSGGGSSVSGGSVKTGSGFGMELVSWSAVKKHQALEEVVIMDSTNPMTSTLI